MTKARILITDRGGPAKSGRPTRGQDVGVFVVGDDGRETLIPGVRHLVLRVSERRAIATLEIDVDRAEVSAANLTTVLQTGGDE